MNLINYPSNRLFGTLDELLKLSLRNLSPSAASSAPTAYHYEDENSHRLRLDLPGFTRDEITLTLEKNTLIISAKSEQENPFDHEIEQAYTLPENIDPEGISAQLENGILDLSIKKISAESDLPRQIKIS